MANTFCKDVFKFIRGIILNLFKFLKKTIYLSKIKFYLYQAMFELLNQIKKEACFRKQLCLLEIVMGITIGGGGVIVAAVLTVFPWTAVKMLGFSFNIIQG